jgi:hypothetical protein
MSSAGGFAIVRLFTGRYRRWRSPIHFAFYASGLMMHVSTPALAQAGRDLASFVRATATEIAGVRP